ncbi:MAG: pantetheine-phosphate adenylyltransferase [Clostridia bacterium]|nr:pantetheine-phosphate adenylyltransferase [Clostridia bacterium]
MSRRIGVYAGSFDPVTAGHMDIIRRAAALFDEVIVTVGNNIGKKCWLSPEDRRKLLEKACAGLPNVRVDATDEAIVCYARRQGASALVRGIRGGADLESERNLAEINRLIAPEIETVLLMARPEMEAVSSSAVREMARFNAPWQSLVPRELQEDIDALFAAHLSKA